jgi:hypothetical protein
MYFVRAFSEVVGRQWYKINWDLVMVYYYTPKPSPTSSCRNPMGGGTWRDTTVVR